MILEVDRLRKSFGATLAVADVSLSLDRGEILGLLGPNGAGKTTTVSTIAGQLPPDAGEVRIEGRPLQSDDDPVKRLLGLVPQELALYESLSARENLRFFAALYGLSGKAMEAALDRELGFVGLLDRANDPVRSFSGGMKRRLNLAAGLLHDPVLLLLDEPTVGVDPQSRNALFENLLALKARGKAILYTTHYMEEAERLCDRIVIVDHGRVIAQDTVRGLLGMLPVADSVHVELSGPSEGSWLDDLRALPAAGTVDVRDGVLTVGLTDLVSGVPEVLGWLSDHGHAWTHVASARADLEMVFLSLTGRRLRD